MALEHPRRRAIFSLLEEQPGLSFRGIVAATGIPTGTARHHVNVLLRAKLVWEHRLGNRFMHFVGQHPVAEARVQAAVVSGLDETPRRVLDLVRDLAPCHQKPILDAAQERLGFARSTTQHALLRLARYGLLAAFAQGRRVIYQIVE